MAAYPSISLTLDSLGERRIGVDAVSGEQVQGETSDNLRARDSVWVELVRDGLSFDLDGLVPGQAAAFPDPVHRIDFAELPSRFDCEPLRLSPGHHLVGGERTMPVAKGLLGLARDLAEHFDDLHAVVWPPSQSVIGRRYFESVISAWLQGGAFPGLGLIAFNETPDGALQSQGLAFWIDQELRLEPPLSSDTIAATRLGVRLIDQLLLVGGIEESERIVAPDGSRLVLRTSRNGEFVQAWRE